jgi:hypothetical protein
MAHTDWAPWAGEVILEAPHWQGPYTVGNRSDLIDHCSYCEEDPFMWKDGRGNWHVLYHRVSGSLALSFRVFSCCIFSPSLPPAATFFLTPQQQQQWQSVVHL